MQAMTTHGAVLYKPHQPITTHEIRFQNLDETNGAFKSKIFDFRILVRSLLPVG